jgi:hypothetical protein
MTKEAIRFIRSFSLMSYNEGGLVQLLKHALALADGYEKLQTAGVDFLEAHSNRGEVDAESYVRFERIIGID